MPFFFQVEGVFYANDFLEKLMFEELKHHSASQGMELSCTSVSKIPNFDYTC